MGRSFEVTYKDTLSCQAEAEAEVAAAAAGAAAEAEAQAEVRRLFTNLHLYLFINFPSILSHSRLLVALQRISGELDVC